MAGGINDRIVDIYTRLGAPAGASFAADLVIIDGFLDRPTADVADNAQMRDVVGNKADAAVTTVGSVASTVAYTKGLLNRLGAPAGASVSADIATIDTNVDTALTRIGAPAVSLAADLAVVDGFLDAPAADSTNTAQVRDTVGNKADAAQTTVGATRSIMAYTKGILNRIGAPAGASIAADIAAIDISTVDTNVDTILTRMGVPAVSLAADLVIIDAFHDVPAQNATTNAQMRDVIGNKTDGSSQDIAVNNVSMMRLIKGIIEAINPASAADNTTAAASAYVSDTLGRKDDTASVTVNTTTTMMRYVKGAVTEISSGTYGLAALDAELEDIRQKATGPAWDQDTDSLEAIREAVDALGGSAPILFWESNVPSTLNLSDADVALSLYLSDARGNLITTAEITPGTCAIDEWNPGTATWVSRLSSTPNNEASGIVSQTETFNVAAGYGSGRTIRITFAGVSATIDGNVVQIPTLQFYSRLLVEGSSGQISFGTNIASSLVADGTEQTVLQTDNTGNYTDDFLLYLDIDLAAMAGGDTTIIRVYKRTDGATFRRVSQTSFVGAQSNPIFSIEGMWGDDSRFIRVSLQQTAGTLRNFPFAGNVIH